MKVEIRSDVWENAASVTEMLQLFVNQMLWWGRLNFAVGFISMFFGGGLFSAIFLLQGVVMVLQSSVALKSHSDYIKRGDKDEGRGKGEKP